MNNYITNHFDGMSIVVAKPEANNIDFNSSDGLIHVYSEKETIYFANKLAGLKGTLSSPTYKQTTKSKNTIVVKRKSILRNIRRLEKKLDRAQKEMDFEAFCDYSVAIGKHYKEIERLNELIVDTEESIYCVNGEYSDGSRFEKTYFNLEDARSAAGCLIENGGIAHLTDDIGNEYPIF